MSSRVEEFVIEAREHLGSIEESLLAMEKSPRAVDSSARFDRCFRSIHSIKGDAGFLGLSRVHELAHAMESLLSVTAQPLAPSVIETLRAARDRLAVLVDHPQDVTGVDTNQVLQRLTESASDASRETFEIDLATWNAEHPGGISRFVLETCQARQISQGLVTIERGDLRKCLPTGSVLWSGVVEALASKSTSDRKKISIDLNEVSARRGGLIGWFSELQSLGSVEHGAIEIADVDMSLGLPSGPVRWSGEVTTAWSDAFVQTW